MKRRYDEEKRGGFFMIDIENELKIVQISYIEESIEKVKYDYYDKSEDTDFPSICLAYREQISHAEWVGDRLTLYKRYYQTVLDYLFRNLQPYDKDEEEEEKDLPFN